MYMAEGDGYWIQNLPLINDMLLSTYCTSS